MICDSVKGWRREKERGVDDKGVEELGTKVDGAGDISGRMKMKYLKHQTGEGVTQVQTPCFLDNGQGYDRRLRSSSSAVTAFLINTLRLKEASLFI
jgi:hypothetical protein